MKLSKRFAVVLALVCIFGIIIAVLCILSQLNIRTDGMSDEKTYEIDGKIYNLSDYLTGCILYGMGGLDNVPDEAAQRGINAAAMALLSNIRYLNKTGADSNGLFSVEFMDSGEAEFYYGSDYEKYLKAAQIACKAAMETEITYNGALVFLPVCRISSVTLMTNAKMPYLKKIYCPIDEKAARYNGGSQLTCDGIAERLHLSYPQMILSPDRESWITDITKDSGGNVISVSCCGITMSGYEFIRTFDIRSVNFAMSFFQNVYSFDTKGEGDSTGLSVYAAVKLSEKGYSEKEILGSFFDGIDIMRY